MSIDITLDFGGGLDILFGGVKSQTITLPISSTEEPTIATLLAYMRDELIEERPELFMQGDTVRPGILVIINEADWEITGCTDTPLSSGDHVTFISTLHGG